MDIMGDTTPRGLQASDAGKRCSDTIALHILAGKAGWWAAIRLSDGGSDNTAYATKRDAIRFQLHETQCAYVCIPPDEMPPHDADRFMKINRDLYDNGFRITDPDDPRTPVVPTQVTRIQ
jgi:hypothetical protein